MIDRMNNLATKFPKTYNHMKVEYREDVAFLTFDLLDEKINKLSSIVLKEFEDALDILSQRNGLKLLVIKSAKKDIFIAGADIKEIENITTAEEAREVVSKGQEIVTKLTRMPFKSLAVINGACMGGGTELALACTFRIASDNSKTKIGLPEVNLGIFPGFGGSQTMPKLIYLPNALDLILSGRALDGKRAAKMGLVDDCYPTAYEEKVMEEWIKKITSKDTKSVYKKRASRKPLIEKIPFIGKKLIFSAARKSLLAKTKGKYPAPLAALDVIERTYGKDLKSGLKIELEEFVKLVIGRISKNFIQLFYTSEELKKEYSEVEVKPVSNVFLLGAGVMGGGIAWLFSNFGISVRMKDISLNGISLGFKQIGEIYKGLVKKRRLKETDLASKYALITTTTTNEGVAKADFILEAIIEDLGIKQKTLNEIESLVKPETIIATNTSSLMLKDISSGMKRPENLVGMHFFNPVNKMPLVEVVKGEKTSDLAVATVVSLAKKMGKTPIVVGDSAGFVVNRLLMVYMNEALFCLQETGDIERIDKIATDFGMPMGPFLLSDEVGIDVAYKVCKNLHAFYGERMAPCSILDDIYNTKKLLGKKAGIGFYIHKGKKSVLNSELANEIQAKSSKSNISDAEILERCLFLMINEATRVLEEKMVKNAKQLDMAMIMGTGFPPFHGGLLKYADFIGIQTIVIKLEEFASKYGAKYTPSFHLQKLAKENSKFYL
jgi:3-hydroxyacyl-CoA dehydrogenase/enoyl-CoA hydratase/3-hydroxybutyryl-CoA epimerase